MAYSPASSSLDSAQEEPARRVKPDQQAGFLDRLSFESSRSSTNVENTSSSDSESKEELNTSEEFAFCI